MTTPTACKGMIVPKESVYVRFVDWGYGPCTKYVVFYTSRDDDEHTAYDYRFARIVFVRVAGIRHPVFVPPLVNDRRATLSTAAVGTAIEATTTPMQLLLFCQ